MGTMADKLGKLLNTKGRIGDLLENRGFDVSNRPFADYPDMLDELVVREDPESPEALYAAYRDKDWLELPEPGENELYMLMLLPSWSESFLSLKIECDGQYTVQWGVSEDGEFIPKGSRQVSSGQVFEKSFSYDDWDHTTSTGMHQTVVQITGGGISCFAVAPNTERNYNYYASWYIVDIRGRLPQVESMTLGSNVATMALSKLRFFSLEGENCITSFAYMFCNCMGLMAVNSLYTGEGTVFSYMFYNCPSLKAVPDLDTSKGTGFAYMFALCSSLAKAPQIDVANAVSLQAMFQNCYTITKLPDLSAARPENISALVAGCQNLVELHGLNISAVTAGTSIFSSNYSLQAITFSGENTAFSVMLTLSYGHMSKDAIEKFLDSLPQISTTQIVMLSYNPGASNVSSEAVERAGDKNWSVIL